MGNINQSLIMAIAIILMTIGVLYQVAIGVAYQRMIQATDTMLGTDNKLLKQCKERFIQCYKLNGGVSNIPIFVDKYINRIRFMGMSVNFIKHLSGQIMMAGVFVAGFGVCKGIIEGKRFVDLLPFYIVSLFGIYLFLSISSIVDMPGRRKILKTNLTDYLENHIAERLEHGIGDKEKLQWELEQEKETIRKPRNTRAVYQEEQEENTFTEKEAKELEELLKSFMM